MRMAARSVAAHATVVEQAPSRVLILSADLAGGHDALAGALALELAARSQPAEVIVRNGLSDANRGAYALMKRAMEGQVTHAPSTYGPFYDLVTRPRSTELMRNAAQFVYGRGLEREIARHHADVVVSTFPMITSAIGRLREQGRIHVPTIGLVIDSNPHAMWFGRGIDRHIVLNPADVARARSLADSSTDLADMRVSSARPAVDPRFIDDMDRTQARAAFGFDVDRQVVLASGGSLGLALPPEQLEQLARRADVQVAVATGRNTSMLRQIESRYDPELVRAIPYTREMPTLLRAADAVISNSGGMTTYESFAVGTPVLFHRPLPGHGVAAARALDADGLALHAEGPDDLVRAVRELAGDRSKVDERIDAAHRLFTDQRPLGDVVIDAANAR
jgi:UDP-N-acetylglucosamine:LPS N-acetylglucosamine transferase